MKKLLIVLFSVFLYTSIFAQVINVIKTSGEIQQFNLSDISSLSFNSMMNANGKLLLQNNLIIYTQTQPVGMFISALDSIYFNGAGTIAYFQTLTGLNQFNLADIDSITFGATLDSTVYITYNDASVTVINPLESLGVSVEVNGADVVVTATSGISDIDYVLSGSTTNGMFKIYSDKKLNLHLNNLQITNNDGPAINIQSSKRISVFLSDETNNYLTDGLNYSAPPSSEDQDAAFFSEGQLIFSGTGTLELNGLGIDKHALNSDDYIEIHDGNIVINCSEKDGINVNDGFFMTGGSINIFSDGDGIDGGEGIISISSGSITIINSANDKAAIKSDSTIMISGGNLNLTVEGNQSKGIDSKKEIVITGGTININTSGGVVLEQSGAGYDPSYCTAIKSDYDVYLSNCDISINTTGIAGRGISCDRNLVISSGSLAILSNGDGGTYTNTVGEPDAYTGPCIKTDGKLIINGGDVTLSHSGNGGKGLTSDGRMYLGTSASSPTINITTTGQSIFISTGNYSEAKAVTADSVIKIENGIIIINSADDGIKSKDSLIINGGVINIAQSYEGLESPNIFINGGDVSVVSSDDGLNATYGVDGEFNDGSKLTINNGYVFVSSTQGDAIDGNGDIYINGGVLVAHGPQSSPEVGLDVNGSCVVSGGFIVISGTNSNMTEGPSNSSTQRSVLLRSTQSVSPGTIFHIEDTSGNSLLTFAPIRRYYSIIFSNSQLVQGTSYRVYTGGSSTGTVRNGLYTGGTYTGGTLRTTFTPNNITQTVWF